MALLGAAFILYALSDDPFYGDEPGFGSVQKVIAAAGMLVALAALLPSRLGAPVLLFMVASLAGLAILEVAGEALLGPVHRPIYQADAELIFKFVPGRRSTMTHLQANGGGKVTHRINSQGFRGAELKSNDALRVAVYGDSFIHAYYTPEKDTFVVRLADHLTRRLGMPVDAVNAGVSSYGPDQVAIKMQKELPLLKPWLALVAVYAGNDYGDLMRNKMFRLAVDRKLEPNPWMLDPDVARRFEISQRESILRRAARSAAASFRTGGPGTPVADLDFFLAEARREYDSFVVHRDNVVTNTHVDYYSGDVSLDPKSESARYKVALMRAVLQRIADIAKSNGVALAFLFIPHPMDVTNGFDVWKPVDRSRYPEYDGRNQIAPLEAAARELGIPFVSLYDLYRAKDASRFYLRGGDDHWNAEGQDLAAAAMAALIGEHGVLRPPGRAR